MGKKGTIFKKLLGLLVIFLFLLTPSAVFAQEKIDSFNSVITAQKNGSMTVEENIQYDFGTNIRHGIFRDIPLVSRVGSLFRVITVQFSEIKRDGQGEEYQINSGAKQMEVKIGDPNITISGVHSYLIRYQVNNGIGSNFTDHDEIYWNVTGNGWTVPIEKVSATLQTDFGVNPGNTICYTGQIGYQDSNCLVEDTLGGKLVTSKQPLNPGEGLTLVASFPVNTFPKSVLQTTEPQLSPSFINFVKLYGILFLALNFLLAPYLIFWYNKHKSKVRFGPPSVNFDIPKDDKNQVITPTEAGIIDNAKLEKDDVTATIFDLAIRKYIKIEEVKTVRKLLPDETDYKIIKLKGYDGLNSFEKELLQRFFETGNSVLISDLRADFYETFNAMETEAFQLLKLKNFYTKNPKVQMWLLLFSGIIASVTLNIVLGLVLIYLSRKLNGRTALGDKIDWQVDGLKIFLKAMTRYYKFQTEKLITVEKYIPYAIALGLQDEFMKQLKIIYPNYQPTWYVGTNNFYGFYPSMYSSMNSSFTTSAPSSSSGFSGGFSGGGGGGGGGGSW